jgi:hypothetical protein
VNIFDFFKRKDKISVKTIAKLNPCKDRFNNYLKHYSDKTFTPKQFMGLRNISHNDKIWVGVRLMDKKLLRFAAADIAELVLPIFEQQHPNDNRPRLAILAARAKILDIKACKEAAADTANAADAADTANAAYVADAADAALAAYYAALAAYYAALAAINVTYVAYAAYYAAWPANAQTNSQNIEKKIRTILLRYLK